MDHLTLSQKLETIDSQIIQTVKHTRKVQFIQSLVNKYYLQDFTNKQSINRALLADDYLLQNPQKHPSFKKLSNNIARQKYLQFEKRKAMTLNQNMKQKQKLKEFDFSKLIVQNQSNNSQIKPTKDNQEIQQSINLYQKYILSQSNIKKNPCQKVACQTTTCQKVKRQYFSHGQTTTIFSSNEKDKAVSIINPKTRQFTIDNIPLVESMFKPDPKEQILEKPELIKEHNEETLKCHQNQQSQLNPRLLKCLLFYVSLLTLLIVYLLIGKSQGQYKSIMIV